MYMCVSVYESYCVWLLEFVSVCCAVEAQYGDKEAEDKPPN